LLTQFFSLIIFSSCFGFQPLYSRKLSISRISLNISYSLSAAISKHLFVLYYWSPLANLPSAPKQELLGWFCSSSTF